MAVDFNKTASDGSISVNRFEKYRSLTDSRFWGSHSAPKLPFSCCWRGRNLWIESLSLIVGRRPSSLTSFFNSGIWDIFLWRVGISCHPECFHIASSNPNPTEDSKLLSMPVSSSRLKSPGCLSPYNSAKRDAPCTKSSHRLTKNSSTQTAASRSISASISTGGFLIDSTIVLSSFSTLWYTV